MESKVTRRGGGARHTCGERVQSEKVASNTDHPHHEQPANRRGSGYIHDVTLGRPATPRNLCDSLAFVFTITFPPPPGTSGCLGYRVFANVAGYVQMLESPPIAPRMQPTGASSLFVFWLAVFCTFKAGSSDRSLPPHFLPDLTVVCTHCISPFVRFNLRYA